MQHLISISEYSNMLMDVGPLEYANILIF